MHHYSKSYLILPIALNYGKETLCFCQETVKRTKRGGNRAHAKTIISKQTPHDDRSHPSLPIHSPLCTCTRSQEMMAEIEGPSLSQQASTTRPPPRSRHVNDHHSVSSRRNQIEEDGEMSWTALVLACRDRLAYMRRHCTRDHVVFFLKQHIPILEWLPAYDMHEDLHYDLVAGVTVGLMIVPQEISLSTMMGVPPIYGLYTAALVPMIYPLFGTSRVLSVANGSEVSLLVGSAIKKIESEDERVATGILLSFLVGMMLFLMGVFRLGVIADFFSRPVMGGFISAGGILIMLSQFANWFGVTVRSHDLPFLTVLGLLEQSDNWNGRSFLVGALSIGILVGMRRLKRSVVLELSKLEEEFEEEFALETTRVMNRMNSQSEFTDDELPRMDVDTDPEEEEKPGYDDVELGDVDSAAKRKQKHADGSNGTPRASTPSRWKNLTSVFSTSALRRSDFVLTSPWSTMNRLDSSRSMDGHDVEARSTRQIDISAVTRSTRHRGGAANLIVDDGVGFSLSDEDYLHLEQPLEYSRRNEDNSRRSGLPPTLTRTASDMSIAVLAKTPVGAATPKRRKLHANGVTNQGKPERLAIESKLTDDTDADGPPSGQKPQTYTRVKNMASPAKSIPDDTASISDSTCSTTALNGRSLESIVSSSMSVRILRSKIAILIALRLVCDLGAFMVCLIGGIIGFLSAEGDLVLTGDVPGGYPSPLLPWYGFLDKIIDTDRLYHIIIDALSIAIISYMSSIAMAKRLAIKEGYRIRPNQELIALGLSNLTGSFFQSMPATGGLSRTAVNMQNARTQLASLITVGVVVFCLYTSTSTLAYLPKASLAAIIIVAGESLIEMKEAKWLYRVKRDEFYVWLASFILTVSLGVLPGLLSSIFCSLIAVIYKTRRPTVTMLGEIVDEATGETKLVDLDLYPDTAQPLSDIVVIRVEGALYFANCEYIDRVITREIRRRQQTEHVYVSGVIIDACSIMDWDSTTIQMMKHMKEDLLNRDIQLAIVNARDRLQNLLQSSEFIYGIVRNDARISFNEAITAIREDALAIPTEIADMDLDAGRRSVNDMGKDRQENEDAVEQKATKETVSI